MSGESDMLSQIFEMVKSKRDEKTAKKARKPLSPEQKEKAIANLQKGRETSKKNRMATAAAKRQAKDTGSAPVAPAPPNPEPVAVITATPPPVVIAAAPTPPAAAPPPRLVPSRRAPEPPAKPPEPVRETPYIYSTFGGGSLW